MKAAVLRKGRFEFDEFPDPQPLVGQVLVKPLACGICGSDLHVVHSSAASEEESGAVPDKTDLRKDLVLGHEFCCEVVESRTGSRFKSGTRVVSYPYIIGAAGPELLGFSNTYPGAFGEQMLLMEDWVLEVPNGLSAEHAALTEPLAVGMHAVARSGIASGDAALVVGCGPVGLAVITALKAGGHGPVIAVDFSPQRRALAENAGADTIIDPAAQSPYDQWAALGIVPKADFMMTAYAMRERLRRVVAFECVGVPGVIQSIIAGVPLGATIVCVGLCGSEDRFFPGMGIMKEIDLRFSIAYSHDEFAATLRGISEGKVDVASFVTGYAGLDGIDAAVEALHEAPSHAKILVCPDRKGFVARDTAGIG